MTDKLPPQLLALFQPRPPLRYLIPVDDSPEEKGTKGSELSGLAAFLPTIDDYKENDEYHPTESWLQKRDREGIEKKQRISEMQKEDFSDFKPDDDPKVKGDALRTLFVGRLSFDVKEGDLEREFGRFGPIERIRVVKDETAPNSKKSHRGYAFVVYERERDMKAAYKDTDGIRIKDRRVVVDVERGRMVPGWRPRRFGGGLGGRGYTKQAPAKPTFGAGPGGFQTGGFQQGGFRGRGGGFRGDFRGDSRGGFRGNDRGGFGGRGGIGYQDRGGFGGRGGFSGAAPQGAPSGPGGGGRGGYGAGGYDDRRNGYSGDRGSGGGGYGRSDRGITGSNREPVASRDRGYEERDRYASGRRDDDYGSRKRHHENDYEDSRQRRRY